MSLCVSWLWQQGEHTEGAKKRFGKERMVQRDAQINQEENGVCLRATQLLISDFESFNSLHFWGTTGWVIEEHTQNQERQRFRSRGGLTDIHILDWYSHFGYTAFKIFFRASFYYAVWIYTCFSPASAHVYFNLVKFLFSLIYISFVWVVEFTFEETWKHSKIGQQHPC